MTRNPGIQESRNTEYRIRSTLKVPIYGASNTRPTAVGVSVQSLDAGKLGREDSYRLSDLLNRMKAIL